MPTPMRSSSWPARMACLTPPIPQPNDFEKAGLDFFDHLLREGREYFDVFDLHLYGDAYTIPARLDFMRRKMAALGYQKRRSSLVNTTAPASSTSPRTGPTSN